MAKGKHATALFEVIHAAKKPTVTARRPAALATPGWWFKTKVDARAAEIPAGSATDPMAAARAELAALKAADTAAPPEPRIIERVVEIEKPVYIDRPVPVPTRAADDDIPLQLDPANHEIRFRLSYVGALAAGFVLLMGLALAYMIGARSSGAGGDTSTVTGSTVGDIAPSQPAAASGQSMMASVSSPPSTAPAGQTAPEAELTRAEAPVAPVTEPTLSAAPTGPVVANRQVGMNYIIVQSYPQIQTAEKACAFLDQRGISCTVVPGPPNWAPHGWYSVVGVQPFDHVQHNPSLDAYKQSIEDLATQFAGNQRFIRFRPAAYKWTDRSDTSAG